MKISAPEQRKATGYWYIKRSNKAWLAMEAIQLKVSQSAAVDILFDELRKKYPVKNIAVSTGSRKRAKTPGPMRKAAVRRGTSKRSRIA